MQGRGTAAGEGYYEGYRQCEDVTGMVKVFGTVAGV